MVECLKTLIRGHLSLIASDQMEIFTNTLQMFIDAGLLTTSGIRLVTGVRVQKVHDLVQFVGRERSLTASQRAGLLSIIAVINLSCSNSPSFLIFV